MIGGLFLMLSYFGCDQSQVQRYLTAKSVDEARQSLLMSAFVKIPLQLLILDDRRAGVRLLPVPDAADAVQPRLRRAGGGRARRRPSTPRCEQRFRRGDRRAPRRRPPRGDRDAFLASDARVQGASARRPSTSSSEATGDARYNDVNYVFPTFITTRMPIGLVGLMIAAIFAAAMSASGGELNALATATVIDFYRRHFVKDATDAHYLRVSKLATIGWGLFACVVAMYAANQGSLIEVVNRYGSFFYGSLLGVFILAILTKRATARGAFWG